MNYALPTGIGDSVWALFKIQAINKTLGDGPIDVFLRGGYGKVDMRAMDFVRRFKFVNSVNMDMFAIHKANEPEIKPDGTYNYLEDGLYEWNGRKYCFLIPNAPLEQGIRLEDWLPHHAINWDIFDDFLITAGERQVGADLRAKIGPYAVFYPGPLAGNTYDGHNRNGLWSPGDWMELAIGIEEKFDLEVVLVGAPYDYAYYEEKMKSSFWANNLIGKTNLGELWSITSQSQFVISYQAGVGIVSTYLGTPTGIFWRPDGDSISSRYYLSFREAMASAWVPPKVLDSGRHLPLYYGRCTPESIVAEVRQRRWHEATARPAPACTG